MKKRKKRPPQQKPAGVRYIVRATMYKKEGVKEPYIKYAHPSANVYNVRSGNAKNQLRRSSRIFKTLEAARKFAHREHRKFSKQKDFSDFAVNVQAFKGRVRKGNKFVLKGGTQSAKASYSKNITKKFSANRASNEIEGVLTDSFYKVMEEEFTPVPTIKKKRKGKRGKKMRRSISTKQRTSLVLEATRERVAEEEKLKLKGSLVEQMKQLGIKPRQKNVQLARRNKAAKAKRGKK